MIFKSVFAGPVANDDPQPLAAADLQIEIADRPEGLIALLAQNSQRFGLRHRERGLPAADRDGNLSTLDSETSLVHILSAKRVFTAQKQ